MKEKCYLPLIGSFSCFLTRFLISIFIVLLIIRDRTEEKSFPDKRIRSGVFLPIGLLFSTRSRFSRSLSLFARTTFVWFIVVIRSSSLSRIFWLLIVISIFFGTEKRIVLIDSNLMKYQTNFSLLAFRLRRPPRPRPLR